MKSCTSAKNYFPMRRTVPTACDIHRLPLCETSPHWHNAFFKLSATQATLPNDHKCDGTITKAGDLIHQISIEQKHTCNFSPHKRLIPSFLFLWFFLFNWCWGRSLLCSFQCSALKYDVTPTSIAARIFFENLVEATKIIAARISGEVMAADISRYIFLAEPAVYYRNPWRCSDL